MQALLLGIAALVVLVLSGALYTPTVRNLSRRAWKDKALVSIGERLNDPRWLPTELEKLQAAQKCGSNSESIWLTPQIIVMTNGDWLAYSSICSKENWKISDIFLAKGSDGRWYYSTYHFCVGMLVPRMEDPSGSLLEFSNTYYLHSFDGRSDECLKQTWPPGR